MTDKPQIKLSQKPQADDTIPSFVKKTYQILEDAKFLDIIDWNPEGTALIIKKPKEFCQKVLPTYFKHNNLTSFIRQLNMYNFHKRRTQEIEHIYLHQFFQRGKKFLLKEIKRKNAEHLHCMQKTMDTLESIQNAQDSSDFTNENRLLTRLNREALARITTLERKTKDLNTQNQSLWSEVCAQNGREETLKQVLTNLMKQFDMSPQELPTLLKNESSKTEKDRILDHLFNNDSSNIFENQTDLNQTPFNDSIDGFLAGSTDNRSIPKPFEPLIMEPSKVKTNNIMPAPLRTDRGPTSLKKEDKQHMSPPNNHWNLEAEYLKSLGATDQRINGPFRDKSSKDKAALLRIKSLDPEHFDNLMPQEPADENKEDNQSKKSLSDKSAADNDDIKSEYKKVKKDQFDQNAIVDLMNFNLA